MCHALLSYFIAISVSTGEMQIGDCGYNVKIHLS